MRLTLAKKSVILFSTFSLSQFCMFYFRYFLLTFSNFFLIYVFHCLLAPHPMLSLLLGQPFLSKWGINVTPNQCDFLQFATPQFNVKREGGDEEEVRAGWGGSDIGRGLLGSERWLFNWSIFWSIFLKRRSEMLFLEQFGLKIAFLALDCWQNIPLTVLPPPPPTNLCNFQ